MKIKYSTLNRISRDVLSIFKSETNVEHFFNQQRNIIYYRRVFLNAKTIKTLIIIQITADKSEKLITLNIDLFIIEFDILNCDNTKDRTKNRKNINTYLSAKLNQYFKVFKNDNSVKNKLFEADCSKGRKGI